MRAIHNIPPVWDERSRVLILGSFPSVRSREERFFYAHPQNRFWSVLAAVFAAPVPETVTQKRVFLLSHRVALWDVAAACEITGSADTTMSGVIPNDLAPILSGAPIERIYTNGKTAHALFDRFVFPATGREATCLPSTSPANAAWSLKDLIGAWRAVAE